MKKIFALLFALTLALCLAACGGSQEEAAEDTAEEPTVEETVPTEEASALIGTWQSSEVQDADGNDYSSHYAPDGLVMEFTENDATVTLEGYALPAQKWEQDGEKGNLVDSDLDVSWVLSGDQLTVTMGAADQTVVFLCAKA